MSKPALAALLLGGLTLAYPVFVYFSLGHFEPRWFALVLLVLAILRWRLSTQPGSWLAVAAALALAALAWLSNDVLPVKLYPVAVSASMLALFAGSLVYPPSIVERLARLSEPDLPNEAVGYTRAVTMVWCGFFLINGLVAAYSAIWASDAFWALYNGGLAYAGMGALAGGEWLIRQRFRARIREQAHG